PAAQSDQNEGPLPQRGRRQEADLPRREQRRAGLDQNQELDGSATRLQNPLRRPTTRLTPPTQKTGHPRRDRRISSRAIAIASQVQTLPFRATQGPYYARADARRQARARTASCGRGGGERW